MNNNLFSDIPEFNDWKLIEKINKGWSSDIKYYIETRVGNKLLLRLSDIKNHQNKLNEFNLMNQIYKLEINMSKPISIGTCDNNYTYSIFEWVDGNSANEVINNFSANEQYKFGIEAGKILKKIHSIPAPKNHAEWENRMLIKIKAHLEKYEKSPYKVENDIFAVNHIKNNLHLLKNRPQYFQHGDYHLGNMVIEDNKLGIIDFNRSDFGDPYEEFYKMILFSREISIPFVKGQINGYFDNTIPNDFFDILSLYVADTILFSIVWAIPFGIKDVEGMMKRAELILSDYDNFKTTIPIYLNN